MHTLHVWTQKHAYQYWTSLADTQFTPVLSRALPSQMGSRTLPSPDILLATTLISASMTCLQELTFILLFAVLDGLMVVENITTPPDYQLPSAIKHIVILTAAYGDSPAQLKMTKHISYHSSLACAHCTLNGQSLEGAMRFMGYLRPVEFGESLPLICELVHCAG